MSKTNFTHIIKSMQEREAPLSEIIREFGHAVMDCANKEIGWMIIELADVQAESEH